MPTGHPRRLPVGRLFFAPCLSAGSVKQPRATLLARFDPVNGVAWLGGQSGRVGPAQRRPTDGGMEDVGLRWWAGAALVPPYELIASKYKGHGMAVLVEAVLAAQGYTTYRSGEGPDSAMW